MAANPAGEEESGALGLQFGRSVKLAFQLAEAALPCAVFAGVLDRINGLRGPPASAVSA